ncbi:kinase-like protein [Byssothecium circinans]|uniref:Kinase-like protein n=1 Tax=Byssothecium circinans TaxID=147558 RepID=A0A6A5U5J3_9PLEO|nr:kinase-like protein [Byssothecium circinans]
MADNDGNPVSTASPDSTIESSYIVSVTCYVKTATTFIKRELLDSERKRRLDGSIIDRPWREERLRNEARALQLVQEYTTIPVPKLIGFGRNKNGLAYLETERLHGIELECIKDQCRKPEGVPHVSEGKCEECSSIAKENAARFICDEVLPQLAKVPKSSTTGLDGFVLPPSWILEYDKRPHWEPKTADSASYFFCHGDLASHNIMMDPNTLKVVAIYDWEHAGYFPPEFQLWFVDRQRYFDYFRDHKRVREFVALLDV